MLGSEVFFHPGLQKLIFWDKYTFYISTLQFELQFCIFFATLFQFKLKNRNRTEVKTILI